jgi:hypothetical protein
MTTTGSELVVITQHANDHDSKTALQYFYCCVFEYRFLVLRAIIPQPTEVYADHNGRAV